MIEVIFFVFIANLYFRRKNVEVSFESFNFFLESKEDRISSKQLGVIVTIVLMLVCLIYVRPASHCSFMGKYYAMMASSPFGFNLDNPVPHRILTSLISYIIGLRGQLVIITNLLFAGGLVYAVYTFFRKHAPKSADAFFAAAIITFSLMTVNTVYYGGYNDSLSYLLIFLMWTNVRRRFLFYGLFLLSLFNRETIVFLLPWLVFLSIHEVSNKMQRYMEMFIGFGISLALYFLFRYWLSHNSEIEYSVSYYLDNFLTNPFGMIKFHFENLWLAIFTVFKIMWIVPVLAFISMWMKGDRFNVASMILLVLGAVTQLFFAYDTSRLLTLSFIVMPLSLLYLYKTDDWQIRNWIIPVFVINMAIPNLNVAGLKIDMIHSLLGYVLIKLF